MVGSFLRGEGPKRMDPEQADMCGPADAPLLAWKQETVALLRSLVLDQEGLEWLGEVPGWVLEERSSRMGVQG